jgi:Ribbon-helix-helix protein, copG family
MATRVTLLLDDDVIAELQKMADRIGRSLEEVVEAAVKSSVRASMSYPISSKPSKPMEIPSKALHARPGIKFGSLEEMLEQAEGPAHR